MIQQLGRFMKSHNCTNFNWEPTGKAPWADILKKLDDIKLEIIRCQNQNRLTLDKDVKKIWQTREADLQNIRQELSQQFQKMVKMKICL